VHTSMMIHPIRQQNQMKRKQQEKVNGWPKKKKNSPPNISNHRHPDRHARSDDNGDYNDDSNHLVDHCILRTEGGERDVIKLAVSQERDISVRFFLNRDLCVSFHNQMFCRIRKGTVFTR